MLQLQLNVVNINCQEQYRKIPIVYQDLYEAFNEQKATQLPPHHEYDCAIDLLPSSTPPGGTIFPLSQPESEAMKSLRKNWPRASSSHRHHPPQPASSSLKRRMEDCTLVSTIWTSTHLHPSSVILFPSYQLHWNSYERPNTFLSSIFEAFIILSESVKGMSGKQPSSHVLDTMNMSSCTSTWQTVHQYSSHLLMISSKTCYTSGSLFT